uniref:Uncharacterized protein n=1 Tax=Oryza brachyantha TaxID=4533 RepID=J3KTY0_ORYBR
MTAPHHRHSRRRTEPHFNLRNNLLTQALALALVGEKLSKAEYKPPYSTSNTQERRIMNAIGFHPLLYTKSGSPLLCLGRSGSRRSFRYTTIARPYSITPTLAWNVLAVVDFDLRITYVLAGSEGSTNDSVVFKLVLWIWEKAAILARAMARVHARQAKDLGGSGAREKPINWPTTLSKFLLDWYVKKIELPPKGVIKKIHHTVCILAMNAKHGTTYTIDQVQRHYKRHK